MPFNLMVTNFFFLACISVLKIRHLLLIKFDEISEKYFFLTYLEHFKNTLPLSLSIMTLRVRTGVAFILGSDTKL